MSDHKKKQTPGMADAENVFDEIETQEKAERKRLWLEEHRSGGDNRNQKGGEKDGNAKGSSSSEGK